MKLLHRFVITGAMVGLLAGASAFAADNYWIGTTDMDFNQATNWSQGTVPTTADPVLFTNAAAQTVQFTASAANDPVQIIESPVTFDLNGYRWTSQNDSPYVIITSAVPVEVRFSSSQSAQVSGGNFAQFGNGNSPSYASSIRGPVTVRVDDDLGAPVQVDWWQSAGSFQNQTQFIAEGPGTVLRVGAFYNNGISGNLLVTNGAEFGMWHYWALGYPGGGGVFTAEVVNASTFRSPGSPGKLGEYLTRDATVMLRDSTWIAEGHGELSYSNYYWYGSGHIQVGYEGLYQVPYQGSIIMSNSTFIGQAMTLGSDYPNYGNGPAAGRLYVLDGSSATFSNQLLVRGTAGLGTRSTLILDSGTITLGGGTSTLYNTSFAGLLTNRGNMRLAGTIRGGNPTKPALVFATAGSSNWIGSSIGTLTLENANLELAAGSVTLWEFSDTGLDQVNVVDGWAMLDGTNLFALAAGSAAPAPGAKWGLGTYDFIIGTGVTVGANFYADMTNLLAGYYLNEGVDYRFGLVDMGSYQALRLEFVPEPSTVLLLVGGGWLLYRVRRRK